MKLPDAMYCAIGLGPSNLSLGALAKTAGLEGIHLERNHEFRWHPGMLLDDATIQVPMLKDLVSAVEPGNPLSFTNFLVQHGRFYEHLNCGFNRILRSEYEQYLGWAASQLPQVTFGAEVIDISHDGQRFITTTNDNEWTSQHIVLGVGQVPNIPRWALGHAPGQVIHSSKFLERAEDTAESDVVVVGGGQSGAEIVYELATRAHPPARIHWITRRSALHPLNESAFANDLFSPSALYEFYDTPAMEQEAQLAEQKFASDGINTELLRKIYQFIYGTKHLRSKGPEIIISTCTETAELSEGSDGRLTLHNSQRDELKELVVDSIVLATGYRQEVPRFMSQIEHRIEKRNAKIRVCRDFSAAWDGPEANKIFIQNGASHAFGIAEPNLSLIPHRNSQIIQTMKVFEGAAR